MCGKKAMMMSFDSGKEQRASKHQLSGEAGAGSPPISQQ
jgi:hypothetical protein